MQLLKLMSPGLRTFFWRFELDECPVHVYRGHLSSSPKLVVSTCIQVSAAAMSDINKWTWIQALPFTSYEFSLLHASWFIWCIHVSVLIVKGTLQHLQTNQKEELVYKQWQWPLMWLWGSRTGSETPRGGINCGGTPPVECNAVWKHDELIKGVNKTRNASLIQSSVSFSNHSKVDCKELSELCSNFIYKLDIFHSYSA